MNRVVIVLVLLLAYLQYRLWVGEDSLLDVHDLQKEVEMQRAENLRLQERNAALDAEVRDLQQGLDAIEERAREDLGMVRQGETFFQVVE